MINGPMCLVRVCTSWNCTTMPPPQACCHVVNIANARVALRAVLPQALSIRDRTLPLRMPLRILNHLVPQSFIVASVLLLLPRVDAMALFIVVVEPHLQVTGCNLAVVHTSDIGGNVDSVREERLSQGVEQQHMPGHRC